MTSHMLMQWLASPLAAWLVYALSSVLNIALLYLAWRGPRWCPRIVISLMFAVAAMHNLLYWHVISSALIPWQWIGFDTINMMVQIGFIVWLWMNDEAAVAAWVGIVFYVSFQEYAFADDGFTAFANAIYHVRVWLDIIAMFWLARVLYRGIGKPDKELPCQTNNSSCPDRSTA